MSQQVSILIFHSLNKHLFIDFKVISAHLNSFSLLPTNKCLLNQVNYHYFVSHISPLIILSLSFFFPPICIYSRCFLLFLLCSNYFLHAEVQLHCQLKSKPPKCSAKSLSTLTKKSSRWSGPMCKVFSQLFPGSHDS